MRRAVQALVMGAAFIAGYGGGMLYDKHQEQPGRNQEIAPTNDIRYKYMRHTRGESITAPFIGYGPSNNYKEKPQTTYALACFNNAVRENIARTQRTSADH